MERIKVSPDAWNFEGVDTGERIFPFGANLVFRYGDGKRSLSLMTAEEWEPDVIRKAFEVAGECHMNLMKVFLPIPALLPDPQENDGARFADMTPTLSERLGFLFDVAGETGVYITLSLAEWGMGQSTWFHDGGEFFGRDDGDGDGIDSYRVFQNLWREIARLLKDEPALFSYNLAVELFIPSGNWGGHDEDRRYLFADRWGLPAWRRWLLKEYGSLDGVNAAWGASFASVDDIRQPEIRWLPAKSEYTEKREIIADYLTFKECAVYLFLKNQTDAIRSVDGDHMITCGFHPDQSGIGPMGFAWKTANAVQREFDMFDYLTVHLYTQLQYLIRRVRNSSKFEDQLVPFMTDAETFLNRRRECILYARFLGGGKPLMVEEFGHLVRDFDESLNGTVELVKALSGHVSGFQLWVLGGNEKTNDYGSMTEELLLSDWGRQWRKVAEPGGIIAEYPKERTPAKTIVKLDRLSGLVPAEETPGEKILRAWDAYLHPVDFDWPGNPIIARYRKDCTWKI